MSRVIVLLLLFVIGTLSGPAVAGIEPDVEHTRPPLTIIDGAFELQSHGVHVRLAPLTPGERSTFFQLRTQLGHDPFTCLYERPKGLTVFEVSFDNRSGQRLSFTPNLAACKVPGGKELLPWHADKYFEMLRICHGGPDITQWSQETERKALAGLSVFHHERLVLENGERATRLLVFDSRTHRMERLILELGPLQVGLQHFSPVMPLRNYEERPSKEQRARSGRSWSTKEQP
ncbi:MAG: hypothetical protein AAF533_01960 [Acidobacteriota bacterium]